MAVVIVSAGMFAQSEPPSCPADRPVDDIIAELHKQQSKKKQRNTDPSPQVTCSWGWCLDHSTTPPTIPEPAPRVEMPSDKNASSSGTSSSRFAVEKCADAMEMALEAAHNIEVGDYFFGEKNYTATLPRNNDALQEKPGDSAIHVRLGRVLEACLPKCSGEGSYGLLNYDGTVKPAFTVLQPLIALLREPGVKDFEPGSLTITFSGAASSMRYILLQKSSGYYLAVWNDVSVYQ